MDGLDGTLDVVDGLDGTLKLEGNEGGPLDDGQLTKVRSLSATSATKVLSVSSMWYIHSPVTGSGERTVKICALP